jgi:vancomycin resistance protein YoaR
MQEISNNISSDNIKQNNISKYGIIIILILLLATLAFAYYGAESILNYKNIYSGVYVEDINVSGLSREAALAKVENKFSQKINEMSIVLKYDGKEKNADGEDLIIDYDIKEAVSKAYMLGREGNIFKRISDIYKLKQNTYTIPVNIVVNEDKVENILQEINGEIYKAPKRNTIIEKENKLFIENGYNGQEIEIEKEKNEVINEIKKYKELISLDIKETEPEKIDVDKLYKNVYRDVKDARYEVTDYKLKIIPAVIGKRIDRDLAQKIIENNIGEGKKYEIPIIISKPKVNEKDIEKNLLKDSISKFTTYYNANYYSRSHNIALAATKIDGIVLDANEEFSFNDIVGPRSLEEGYQVAHVYFGGDIIDGVGGGICQVSSTIYNAVLYANLEVLERTNHSMTVSYVPLGQDAAVSYGTINFKFKNNTNWPIKLQAKTDKGSITVEIVGTNENPDTTIEIQNDVISVFPYEEEFVEDPEIYIGEEEVKQKGGNGFLVKSYKITKLKDEIINKEDLSISKYRPITQIIQKGIKEPEPEEDENIPNEEGSSDIISDQESEM